MSPTTGTSLPSSLQNAQASHRYHSKANSNHQGPTDQHDNLYTPFRADSYGLHELPDPPSPAGSYQSSNIDKFNALSLNTQDLDFSQGHRRPHRETMGATPKESGSIGLPEKASLRRNQTEKKPLNPLRRSSAGSFPASPSEAPAPHQESQLPTSPASSSPNHHPSGTSTEDVGHETLLAPTYQQQHGPGRHYHLKKDCRGRRRKSRAIRYCSRVKKT